MRKIKIIEGLQSSTRVQWLLTVTKRSGFPNNFKIKLISRMGAIYILYIVHVHLFTHLHI